MFIRTTFLFSLFTLALAACGSEPSGIASNPAFTGSTSYQLRGVIRAERAWSAGRSIDLNGASVLLNGAPSTTSELGDGMVAQISGTLINGLPGPADSVETENELRGTIESIDLGGNTFVVLGSTVLVSEQTAWANASGLAGLAVNDDVEVHGDRDTAGTVHATRVELKTGDDEGLDEIRGLVSGLGDRTFFIGDLEIDYAGATFEPVGSTLSEGDLVEVHGELSGGTFLANRIELEDHAEDNGIDDDPAKREVRIEANVTSITEGNIAVLGLDVALASTSEMDVAPVAGDGVRIEAHLDADGFSLVAIRVDVDSSPVRSDDNILRGPVTESDAAAQTFVIAGMVIDASSAEYRDRNDMPMTAEDFYAALAMPGAVAKGKGELIDGTLVAEEAELE